MLAVGGVACTTPILLPASLGSSIVSTPSSPLPFGKDQHVGRAVIGVGVLHELVALGVAHDDVAAIGPQRIADEAHDHRETRYRRRICGRSSRRPARPACFRNPRRSRRWTACSTDRRRPAACPGRPVRPPRPSPAPCALSVRRQQRRVRRGPAGAAQSVEARRCVISSTHAGRFRVFRGSAACRPSWAAGRAADRRRRARADRRRDRPCSSRRSCCRRRPA